MKVIIGLGNPGRTYAGTRHNVGFSVVGRLAERWSIPLKKSLCRCRVGEGVVDGHSVRLVQPRAWMNASGEAVGCLVRRWKLDRSGWLVVCDDVRLPLGAIRLRGQGSAGGHRGLSSILEALDSDHVARLRVGIGAHPGLEEPLADGRDFSGLVAGAAKSKRELTPFVLGRFRLEEKKPLEEGLRAAGLACEVWVQKGLTAAMNLFNQKVRV